MPKQSRSEYWVNDNVNTVTKVSDSSSIYKQIKRENKVVSRPAHLVFFEFDDDPVAPIYAFLNYDRKGEGIVYAPTLALDNSGLFTRITIAYAIVTKTGIYHYSEVAVRDALKKNVAKKGGLRFLSGWRDQQAWARKSIEDMVNDYNEGKIKF